MRSSSLLLAQRAYRLGDGYGPATLPQGNGAPPVPTSARVLFDWDPSFDPFRDRVGGITFTESGTGVSVESHRSLPPCGVFDGSGALIGDGAPFAALSDLTGGVSIYVVCERTDVDVSARVACGVDEAAGASGENYLGVHWNGNDGVSAINANDAASVQLDNCLGLAVRNTVEVLSLSSTTGFITSRVDGSPNGVGTAITSGDPTALDRFVIGDGPLYIEPVAAGWVGRIYRVLVVEGDYDAAVLTYLQGLYTPRYNAIFDFNPGASLTVDQASGLALTNNGSVTTETVRGGLTAAVFNGTDQYLSGTWSLYDTLSDFNGGLSIYVVCERTDTSADNRVPFHIHTGAATVLNSIYLQNLSGDDVAGAVYDGTALTFDTEAGAGVLNQLQVYSFHATTTARTAKVDGTGTAETSGTTRDPTGMDEFYIGALESSSVTQHFPGRIYRVLVMPGAYDADVLAKLQADYTQGKPRLPDGVDESDVLMVYDPEWSRLNEWASDGTFTPVGTTSYEELEGHLVLVTPEGAANQLQLGTTPLSTLDGEEPVTIFVVAENDANGTFGTWLCGMVDGAGVAVNSMAATLRDVAGTGAGWGGYANSVAAIDYSGGQATEGVIATAGTKWTGTGFECFLDGVSDGSEAASDPPTSLDTVWIGPYSASVGGAKIFYALIFRGSPSDVQSWAEATFPVGTDTTPPGPSVVGEAVGTISTNTSDVTLPSGIQSGDLIVLFHAFRVGSVGQTGYTTEFSRTTGDGSLAVYSKVADGTESGTVVTTTNAGSASNSQTLHAIVFRNADTVDGTGGDNATFPAHTFGVAGTGFVYRHFVTYRSISPINVPSGTTEIDQQSGTGVMASGLWKDNDNPKSSAASTTTSTSITFGADTATIAVYLAS